VFECSGEVMNIKVNLRAGSLTVVVYLQQNKKKAKAEGKKCHAKTVESGKADI
jgi:hypothetical protein